jgi:hypothetical protein
MVEWGDQRPGGDANAIGAGGNRSRKRQRRGAVGIAGPVVFKNENTLEAPPVGGSALVQAGGVERVDVRPERRRPQVVLEGQPHHRTILIATVGEISLRSMR